MSHPEDWPVEPVDETPPEPERRDVGDDQDPRTDLLYKAWGLLREVDVDRQPEGWRTAHHDWLRKVRELLVDKARG